MVAALPLGIAGALLAAQAAPTLALPDDHAERMTRGLALFTERIEPLLKDRCVKCHGGESLRGQLDLVTREGLLAGGKNGPAVVPFDGAASRLVQQVRGDEQPAMPFKLPKLDDASIAELAEWVDLGAPYARPLLERKEAKKGPREVTDADRDFWSFRPLARPATPATPAGFDASWARHDVDRFVAAGLARRGLAPSPPAPRRALLRRLWFDLVGLPPPPEEVEAFVADASADSFERRVDLLLGSDRFGERWARHWLDLVRFAESHGFEHDYDRPNAWTYRDFVIDAFNADLPFDRFVQWQLAGDEFAPDDPRAWFATGFLAAGVHATQITANQVEKERYDELDDVVATIGTSMLGLTVGCARCHDHKFDPIPTRDYYRMVATFTKTVRSDFDVVLDAPAQRERLAAWTAEHEPLVAARERHEREVLAPRFDEWLAAGAPPDPAQPAPWLLLEPASLTSSGGATFTRLDDGSWLAGGPRAEHDDDTFVARLPASALPRLASLRIEALADFSLVKGGPGRADNGNFALTELRASWKPDGAGEATPLAFTGARSTYDQPGLPASAAIDGVDADDSASWAVDPRFGKDHAAAFALAAPIDTGGELTITLLFRNNHFHSIGRLRIAAAASADAELQGAALPAPSSPRERLFQAWVRLDPEWRALEEQVTSHLAAQPKPALQKALVCSEGLPAVRLHTQGGDFLEETHFLKRGDPNQKLDVATPAYLQVLTRAPDLERHWQAAPPDGARTPWQRRALASWLTDVDAGAGSLLARVAANRAWQHLFGRGIVATPSDFGATGAKPTQPELLEWLACELVERGWSWKQIVRLLVTSAAYRQGDAGDGSDENSGRALELDPENELFGRQPPRRLEGEAIRDALLSVSGKLDLRMHGPGVLDAADPRRSVYLFVKRSKLVPMMSLFDTPNALSGVGRRQSTTVAPQALFLMNAPAVRAWAEAFAARIEGELSGSAKGAAVDDAAANSSFVRRAFALAFARPPTDDELADSLDFLKNPNREPRRPGVAARLRPRIDLCHALFCANEFVYVE